MKENDWLKNESVILVIYDLPNILSMNQIILHSNMLINVTWKWFKCIELSFYVNCP